jgi:flavin-dependent dehydrogenase
VKPFDAEIVVVGGGPAGATIANRLAKLKYDVLIIEASEFPRPHVGESLQAHVVSLFEKLGVLEEIESAGFLRPQSVLVRWGGETRFRTDVTDGFQVDRGRFDTILLQAAVRSGARIIQPGRVSEIKHLRHGEWELTVAGYEERHRLLRSRFVVDASGRRGCLPGSRSLLQPPTIALYSYWQDTELEGAETRIEAGTEHWYWAAALPDSTANVTVFLGSNRCRNRGGTPIKDVYLRLISESSLLSRCLSGALVQTIQACSATASRILEPVGVDWIKIGEAALAYDPLSSQGVQNAIVSGLQGAAVVHTLLSDPRSQRTAIAFFRDRVDEAATHHAAIAADFYGQQAKITPLPFWIERANGHVTPKPLEPRPLNDLHWHTILQLNPLAKWRDAPVLVDDRIVLKSALCLQRRRPVVWIEGETVSDLLNALDHRSTAFGLVSCWSKRIGSERALRTMRWLWHNDFFRPVDCAISDPMQIRNNGDSTNWFSLPQRLERKSDADSPAE